MSYNILPIFVCRNFILITDYEPLSTIFDLKKGILTSQLHYCKDSLFSINLYLWHRILSNHSVDALSWLPLISSKDSSRTCFDSVFILGQVSVIPVTCNQLGTATCMTLYSQECYNTLKRDGQPELIHSQHELTNEGHRLLCGIRVIVPQKYQKWILEEIQMDHPGISRMKSISCRYVWWQGLEADIEVVAKSCLLFFQSSHLLTSLPETSIFGFPSIGPGFTWTLQVLGMERPISLSWIHIQNDQRCLRCSRLQQIRPLKSYKFLPTMDYLTKFYQTTVLNSMLTSFIHF